MAPGYGFATAVAIDTNATPSAGRVDFQSETLALDEEMLDTSGLRGTRSHVVERVRQGIRRCHGTLHLQPTAVEWASLLPWILGTAASGNIYALADTVPSRYVMIDRVAKVFEYSSVRVNRAVIRGQQAQPIDLELDLVGSDESIGNAGSFPVLTLDTTTGPFVFTDLVLTIATVAYSCKNCVITIDNMLDADRFFNAQVLSTAANAKDRRITLETSLPYGDAVAAYGSGSGGVAANATYTNGNTSLALDFIKCVFPRKSPTVPGREEVMLPLVGVAYRSGSTLELVTTLDSTP